MHKRCIMNEQMIQKIKKYTIIVMVVVCLYFFLARPYIQFKKDENTMLNAVKRYCEVNENTMATGRRVSTITLDTLFKEKYLDKDFHIPFSKKVCSPTKSWAKVTKVDSERKYYIYLDCGILKSNVDHEGPVIKLNGDTEMTISRYSKFKDPGIESVVDACKNAGIIVLDKDKLEFQNLNIYGLTYSFEDIEMPTDEEIQNSINPNLINILNYHVPYRWEEFSSLGFDIQLSGHTHGGQFYPAINFTGLMFKYNKGLFRDDLGNYLHVTTGVGCMDTPMRWGTDSELVVLKLRKN